MSMSELEVRLTQRVSGLEAELAATRRKYYVVCDERDALLRENEKRIDREIARLTPNVTGPSSVRKVDMLLARLNGNVCV